MRNNNTMFNMRFLIIILFSCFANHLFAQKIDTLIFFSNQKNALSLYYNKNYQKALELFKVNFNFLESIDDKLNEGNSTFFNSKYSYLTYLKDCSIAINKNEDAIQYGVKAIQYYRLTYDTLTKEYPDKFAELSRLNNQIYNYDESIKFQTRALDLNEKIFGNKSKEYIMSLHNLGLYYEKDGDYLNSNRIFSKSFNIANLIYKETDTLLYKYQYEYIKSQFYNEKINESLELCKINSEKIKNFIGVENRIYINYLNLISLILINSNEISKSIEYNLENERLARLVFGEKSKYFYESQIIKSKIFKVIGDVYSSLIIDTNLLNLCIAIYGNESHESCLLYADIASLENQLNNKDKALIFALEASKIAEKIYNKNDVNYINILGLKANILFSEGLYSDAIKINGKIIEFYKKNINYNLKTYIIYLSNQAYMYQSINDIYQAERTYSEIFKLINSSNNTEHIFKRSILLDYFYFSANSKKYKTADSLCLIISDLNSLIYNENIANLNDEQRIVFLDHWHSINSLVLEYSISRNNKNILLENNSKILNFHFNKYYSKTINYSTNNYELTLLKNNKNLLYKFLESNSSRSKIDSIKMVIKQQEIEISKSNFNNIIKEKKLNHIKALSKRLNKKEIIIHISKNNYYQQNRGFSDSAFYLISIINSKNKVEFIILKNGKHVDSIININKDHINKKINNESDSLVYSEIWKPIKEKISDTKTVFLYTDGETKKINFNTIFDQNVKRYLIEDYNFNYITNLSDFVNYKKDTQNEINLKTSVLIGSPNFNNSLKENKIKLDSLYSYNPLSLRNFNMDIIDSNARGNKIRSLPNTKIEIQNIEKILMSNKIKNTSFIEDDATEGHLKSINSPSILHIATHGYFVEDEKLKSSNSLLGFNKSKLIENPLLRSGLMLTGAGNFLNGNSKSQNENGLFTALEASALDLTNTELVVLSACETGRGKLINGQGVQGLQKGFKDAGAKKIIMSLWKVDDKVTQEFMTTFYTLLFIEKDIHTAFTKTQLQIKEKYKLPYYWGAFILSE